jgi:uncharacterized repeat protein (TIGR01451 family)
VVFVALILAPPVMAKSLYLASDHHSSQFDAWSINPDGTVDFQAVYGLHYSTDPAGIAIDEDSGVMFITSEFSGGVEMVDPVTLTYLGVSAGPSNLAGIDIDDMDDIVFAVQRYTSNLYIFRWHEDTLTLTQEAMIVLPNCSGAFGLALDEFMDVLWVADSAGNMVRAYDVGVSSWDQIAEIPELAFRPSHMPIDIAVDRVREAVFTVSMNRGAWTPPGAGSNLISRYDLASGVETTATLSCQGVGIAVDEATGFAYITLSPYCSYPYRGRVESWDPGTSPWTQVDSDLVAGSPAGIATANISYNPLKLAKNDVIEGEVYVGSQFTYEITYENPNPFEVTNAWILDTLPPELDFVSATHGGIYDAVEHTVDWELGTLPAEMAPVTVDLVVKVNDAAVPGSVIYNYVTIGGDQLPDTTVIDDEGSSDPGDEPGTPIGESIPVPVDIKPMSCPNPLGTRDRGVVPVAIVGTTDFDVMDVDPATVTLEGVAPVRWAYEDAATPYEPYIGKQDCMDCTTAGMDGFMDLTLKFDAQELVEALGEVEDGECRVLVLAGGTLLEDGTQGPPIFGEDVVRILDKR